MEWKGGAAGMSRRHRLGARALTVLCGLAALVATTAGPAVASAKSTAKSGGIATFALPGAETST